MPRYEDDYGRRDDPRAAPVRREVREDRHRGDRVEQRERTRVLEEPPREAPSRSRLDPMEVVDSRRVLADPRPANAGVRLEPRPGRHGDVDPRARDQAPTYYEDPKIGRLVDARDPGTYPRGEPAGRYSAPRDDRMDTEMDMQPSRRSNARDVVDSGRDYYMEDDHKSNKYNEYFVPGAGIDREVIQHEICRYLGNDATVRPYTNKDGRTGFLVRAYRALTTAMIEDLRKDSARWRQDQDRRSRSGRNTVSYAGYAESIKGRQEVDFQDTMDVDDHPYEAPPRHRELDPRDPRAPSGRHALPVSSGAYPPDPYQTYSIAPSQQGNYRPEMDPRYPGNTTPPTGRAPLGGYTQPGYQGRSSAAPPPSVPAYRDPRTGQIVSGYDAGYGDSGRRHGR